jgi:hypothetical protein
VTPAPPPESVPAIVSTAGGVVPTVGSAISSSLRRHYPDRFLRSAAR